MEDRMEDKNNMNKDRMEDKNIDDGR